MLNEYLDHQTMFNMIESRRTCYQFLDKKSHPVEKDKLDLCIQSAIYAPNHKLTQPWHFWVIGKQFKTQLATIYADNRAAKRSQKNSDCYQEFYDKAVEKFEAIPQVVLVAQQLNSDSIIRQEDYAACSCAIQNFQLMAWSQKIGVQWSTGPIIDDLSTYEALSINKDEYQIIGALYLGNIDSSCLPKQRPKRKSVSEVTEYTL